MGALKDISGAIKDISSIINPAEIGNAIRDARSTSLSRKGAEGTLQFPNLVSRANDIDVAIMINKALERQYAVFTQITISMNPYLDLSKDGDVNSYLRRFHQNNKKGFLNTIGDLTLEDNASVLMNDDESLEALFIVAEGSSSKAIKDNKDNLYCTMDYINENCLNDLYTPKDPKVNFKNPNLTNFFNNRLFDEAEIVTEAKGKGKGKGKQVNYKNDYDLKLKQFNHKKSVDSANALFNKEKFIHQKNQDALNYNLKDLQFQQKQAQDDYNNEFKERQFQDQKDQNKIVNDLNERKFKHQKDQNKIVNDLNERKFKHQQDQDTKTNDYREQQRMDQIDRYGAEVELRKREMNINNMGNTSVKMSDSDCKKANELVPTTLAVTLNVKDEGNFGGSINFVLGIKTVMHPITSDEMIRNLVLACKNSSNFFKFIKWTTGEIKFVKDLLLNITDIRTDVLNTMSKKESGWFTALKKRRLTSGFKRMITRKGLLPNASVTVTMDEVQIIRSQYGYDLTDPKLVIKIMQEYFLLSFVIVDSSQELAMFLFDGENHFQTMSFTGLERENNNKNDFKEIYKLINSGRI